MTSDEHRILTETLARASAEIGIPLTGEQIAACQTYAELLLAYNRHTNLTRIVDPAAVAVKHFADSLTVLRACPDIAHGAILADIGTGAGFPGLVLKIARPDLKITLIDSLRKRLTFLEQVIAALGLTDIRCIHARAEDAGRSTEHRGRYDLVTARAVAALPTLLQWCGPLVRPGGRMVALKSAAVEAEIAVSAPVAAAEGLKLESDLALTLPALPDEEDAAGVRRILVLRKHTDQHLKMRPRRNGDGKIGSAPQ